MTSNSMGSSLSSVARSTSYPIAIKRCGGIGPLRRAPPAIRGSAVRAEERDFFWGGQLKVACGDHHLRRPGTLADLGLILGWSEMDRIERRVPRVCNAESIDSVRTACGMSAPSLMWMMAPGRPGTDWYTLVSMLCVADPAGGGGPTRG